MSVLAHFKLGNVNGFINIASTYNHLLLAKINNHVIILYNSNTEEAATCRLNTTGSVEVHITDIKIVKEMIDDYVLGILRYESIHHTSCYTIFSNLNSIITPGLSSLDMIFDRLVNMCIRI